MSAESTLIKQELRTYLNSYYDNINTPILKKLIAEARANGIPDIHISIEQAAFLQWLIHSLRLKTILEIGTLAGYSALIMAQALPDDGLLTTVEKNKRFAPVAQKYWRISDLNSKIKQHIAAAEEIMPHLIRQGKRYDLIFIDADKNNYDFYYESALQLLSHIGIIAIDNTFAFGRVNEKDFSTPEVEAIRRLNKKIKTDKRIENLLLPLGDGLTLIRKKER